MITQHRCFVFFTFGTASPQMGVTHVGQPVVGLEQLGVAGKTACSPSLAPDPQPCRSGTQRCSALEIISQWTMGLPLGRPSRLSQNNFSSQIYRFLSTPFLRRSSISQDIVRAVITQQRLLLSQTTVCHIMQRFSPLVRAFIRASSTASWHSSIPTTLFTF